MASFKTKYVDEVIKFVFEFQTLRNSLFYSTKLEQAAMIHNYIYINRCNIALESA